MCIQVTHKPLVQRSTKGDSNDFFKCKYKRHTSHVLMLTHITPKVVSLAVCCCISFSKYARRWMKMPPYWSCRSEPALITSSTETPSFRILEHLLDFTNTFLDVDNARLRILHTEVMKLGDASNWFEKPHQKSIPLSPLPIKHLSFIHMR